MSKDRERQAIALVACPRCGAAIGQPCLDLGGQPLGRHRPMVHTERRHAWQAARPTDPLSADIVMSSHKDPPRPGETHGRDYLLLAPLTDRGRAALPAGVTRVPHTQSRATLSQLRAQGLVVLRED